MHAVHVHLMSRCMLLLHVELKMFFKCFLAIVRLCFDLGKAILGFLLFKGMVIILQLVHTPTPISTGMH